MQKEYGEIQPLVLYTSSPNLLVSNKREVKTLDDFKGVKFRVLGGPPTEMAKALGAVPTLIPMPDVYQSLDKGVVDAAAAPWEAVHGVPALRGGQELHRRAVLRGVFLRSAPTGRRSRACRRTCASRS